MKKKFLYLDDNDKVTRDGDVKLINTISQRISITTDYPCSWGQRVRLILNDIANIDGLILDWELTNKSENAKFGTEQASDVDFSAESLAEHIRVSVIQQAQPIKDIPIILCSADKNKAFSNVRSKELTSRNLFDLAYLKSDLFDQQVETSESQLFDLAIAYESLQPKNKEITELLNIEQEELNSLDIRFTEAFNILLRENTAHDLVQFLLNNLILREGILINESVLGARLGIDITASKDKGWENLLQILFENKIHYDGLLSIGWKNFWAFKLEKWWTENISKDELRVLDAVQRVKLINKKFNLELTPADKIKFCNSNEFWTVCIGTKRPIDPLDGFRIIDETLNPWLELKYVSAYAELEKEDSNSWKIDILDKERFNHYKKFIKEKK